MTIGRFHNVFPKPLLFLYVYVRTSAAFEICKKAEIKSSMAKNTRAYLQRSTDNIAYEIFNCNISPSHTILSNPGYRYREFNYKNIDI